MSIAKKQNEARSFDDELLEQGTDELNLAEFPMSMISSRAAEGIKAIEFRDEVYDPKLREKVPRTITVQGGAKTGLPTGADEDVLLALVQLAKRSGFRGEQIRFSRYELLRILGWPDNGKSYNRIRQSFEVWLGTSITWTHAWRNYREEAHYRDKGINLISGYSLRSGDDPVGDSTFSWTPEFFETFRRGNLKSLNYRQYRSFRSQIAKRMFRFLDKHFYRRKRIEIDLETFAFEKVGMKRSYRLSNIKEVFKGPLRELEEIGFIRPATHQERYRKRGKGRWNIIFTMAPHQPELDILDMEVVSETETRLVKLGVSRGVAKRLVVRQSDAEIGLQIEHLEWMQSQGGDHAPKNPGGWLAKAISERWQPPEGFQTREQRETEAEEQARKRRAAQEKRERLFEEERLCKERVAAAEEAIKSRAESWLEGLSAAERAAVHEEAESAADAAFPKLKGGAFWNVERQSRLREIALNRMGDGR